MSSVNSVNSLTWASPSSFKPVLLISHPFLPTTLNPLFPIALNQAHKLAPSTRGSLVSRLCKRKRPLGCHPQGSPQAVGVLLYRIVNLIYSSNIVVFPFQLLIESINMFLFFLFLGNFFLTVEILFSPSWLENTIQSVLSRIRHNPA